MSRMMKILEEEIEFAFNEPTIATTMEDIEEIHYGRDLAGNSSDPVHDVTSSYNEYDLSKTLWISVAPILLVVGTVGSGLSLLVLCRKSMRQQTTMFYLAVLAVADVAVLYSGLLRLWLENRMDIYIRLESSLACKLHTFCVYLCLDTSVWVTVAVSLDRCLYVSVPYQAKRWCTMSRARWVVVVIIILMAVINCHFFWTYDREKTQSASIAGNNEYRCYVVSHSEVSQKFIKKVWPWVDFCIYCLIPFIIMSITTLIIVRNLVKTDRKMAAHRKLAPKPIQTNQTLVQKGNQGGGQRNLKLKNGDTNSYKEKNSSPVHVTDFISKTGTNINIHSAVNGVSEKVELGNNRGKTNDNNESQDDICRGTTRTSDISQIATVKTKKFLRRQSTPKCSNNNEKVEIINQTKMAGFSMLKKHSRILPLLCNKPNESGGGLHIPNHCVSETSLTNSSIFLAKSISGGPSEELTGIGSKKEITHRLDWFEMIKKKHQQTTVSGSESEHSDTVFGEPQHVFCVRDSGYLKQQQELEMCRKQKQQNGSNARHQKQFLLGLQNYEESKFSDMSACEHFLWDSTKLLSKLEDEVERQTRTSDMHEKDFADHRLTDSNILRIPNSSLAETKHDLELLNGKPLSTVQTNIQFADLMSRKESNVKAMNHHNNNNTDDQGSTDKYDSESNQEKRENCTSPERVKSSTEMVSNHCKHTKEEEKRGTCEIESELSTYHLDDESDDPKPKETETNYDIHEIDTRPTKLGKDLLAKCKSNEIKAKKVEAVSKQQVNEASHSNKNKTLPNCQSGHKPRVRQISTSRSQTTSVSMTLISINVVFWILNAPIMVFVIGFTYWTEEASDHRIARLHLGWTLVNLLQYANSAGHVFLYCLTGPRFRQELMAVLKSFWLKLKF